MKEIDQFIEKNGHHSAAHPDWEKAKAQFDEQAYQSALGILVWGFKKDVNYHPLYQLTIQCLQELGATQEKEMFEMALNNFDHFESFNRLGQHFYETNQLSLAIPFFEKAVDIDASNLETIHDLAIVYARQFQIEKAINVLQENHPEKDFWNFWFWCKLSILGEKLEGVEAGLNDMSSLLDEEQDQEAIAFPRQKVNEVKEILLRYQQVKTPQKHIQDWHFIQYGGMILDFFDDSEDYVAGGRYVASWGSKQSIKETVLRLKFALDQMQVNIQSIKYLNDRNATILGLLIGKVLGLPAEVYQSDTDNKNALIVAANSVDYDTCLELTTIDEGQIVFAVNHCWLESAHVSPDIVGFMTQTYHFPWEGGGIKINPNVEGETTSTEADERSEMEIANEIHAITLDSAVTADRNEFYLAQKDYLKSIGSKTDRSRYNFMTESPVPGAYFG